jgi:hypothetical protein
MKKSGYFSIATIFLSACNYSGQSQQIAAGSEASGTGSIRFSEEIAGAVRLLNLSVSPGLLETEGSMAQRMFSFATKHAATACGGELNFIQDPNPEVRISNFTERSKAYAYRCG